MSVVDQSGFTPLEWAVLEALCHRDERVGQTLLRQLRSARIVERDNSGAGFFTSFEVDRSLAPAAVQNPMSCPSAEVHGIADGMGFLLWFDRSRPAPGGLYADCLEGHTYGNQATTDLDWWSLSFRLFD